MCSGWLFLSWSDLTGSNTAIERSRRSCDQETRPLQTLNKINSFDQPVLNKEERNRPVGFGVWVEIKWRINGNRRQNAFERDKNLKALTQCQELATRATRAVMISSTEVFAFFRNTCARGDAFLRAWLPVFGLCGCYGAPKITVLQFRSNASQVHEPSAILCGF